jgi:hypothetical protein
MCADINCHKVSLDDQLYIQNNSNKTIYWDMSDNYPDTTIIGIRVKHNKITNTIAPNTRATLFNGNRGYSELFDPQALPSGKLQVFIFDAAALDNTPDEAIKPNMFVLKRFVLTADSIVKLKRVITYP